MLTNLPNDILILIGNVLPINDTSNLVFVNKQLQNLFINEINEQCRKEIENNWNSLVPDARYLARSKDKKYYSLLGSFFK